MDEDRESTFYSTSQHLIQVAEGPSFEVPIWLVDLANLLELMLDFHHVQSFAFKTN